MLIHIIFESMHQAQDLYNNICHQYNRIVELAKGPHPAVHRWEHYEIREEEDPDNMLVRARAVDDGFTDLDFRPHADGNQSYYRGMLMMKDWCLFFHKLCCRTKYVTSVTIEKHLTVPESLEFMREDLIVVAKVHISADVRQLMEEPGYCHQEHTSGNFSMTFNYKNRTDIAISTPKAVIMNTTPIQVHLKDCDDHCVDMKMGRGWEDIDRNDWFGWDCNEYDGTIGLNSSGSLVKKKNSPETVRDHLEAMLINTNLTKI